MIYLVAGSVLLGTGCKKFLDINDDPNNPPSVQESMMLGPVEVTTSTWVVGGYCGIISSYWMQQLSLNQSTPSVESYNVTPPDVENTWSWALYPHVFNNLNTMIDVARSRHNNRYVAIGKVLIAYNLAITTDLWGNIPFSKGFKVTTVKQTPYDKQEEIYATIDQTLDSALYYIAQPAGPAVPGTEDYIYGGKMDQWKKLVYMLKARYAMRLSKAPGHTPGEQADKALAALANGFSDNKDNAAVAYTGGGQAESPWYVNTQDAAGGVVMAQSFIDSLVSRKDPRLSVIAAKSKDSVYAGRRVGDAPAPDLESFSHVNEFYAGAAASLYLATYSEALFIKAEATFIKQGAAAAAPIYRSAIAQHMTMLGISPEAQQTYIASRPALTTANALEQIITEKYIANFLSPEVYNDWRRTGFPVLKPYKDEVVNSIPRRWPYPASEPLTNPQPDQKVTLNDRVWWDAN